MRSVKKQECRAKSRRSPGGFPAFGEPRAQLFRNHLVPTSLGSFGTLEPAFGECIVEPIVREKSLLGRTRRDAEEERVDLELEATPLIQRDGPGQFCQYRITETIPVRG